MAVGSDPQMNVKISADAGNTPAEMKKVKQSVDDVKESVDSLKQSVDGIKEGFERLGDQIKELVAFEAIIKYTEHFEELGNTIITLSAQMGATKQEAAELIGIFKTIGAQGLESGRQMVVFQRNISTAIEDPASRQAQALRNVGISTDELKAKQGDAVALLDRVRQAWQQYGDGVNKTANFQAFMGLSLASTIPYLVKTDEQVAEIRDRTREFQAVLAESAQGWSDTGEKFNEMRLHAEVFGGTLFNQVKPAIDDLFDSLSNVVDWLTKGTNEIADFISKSPEMSAMGVAFKELGISAGEAAAGIIKFVTSLVTDKEFLEGITNTIKGLAIGVATISAIVGAYKEEIQYQNERAKAALEARDKMAQYAKELLDLNIQLLSARVTRNKEAQAQILATIAETEDKAKKLHDEFYGSLDKKEEGHFKDSIGRWDKWLARIKEILNNVDNASKKQPIDPNFLDANKPAGRGEAKPDAPSAPHIGRGAHHGEVENFMQEWRDALHKQEIANNDFFEKAKARELDYWTEKKAWTDAHQKEILAKYEAAGLSKQQADQKYKNLEFQLDEQIFQLTKARENQKLSDFKRDIDMQLQELQTQYKQRLISEEEWYTQSVALNEKYFAELRRLRLEDTKQWDDAVKQRRKIEADNVKNITEIWKSGFDFLNNGLTTFISGVMSGSKSMAQVFRDTVKSMLTQFIEAVAKMILQWLALKAVVAAFGPEFAKAIGLGNPFSKITDAFQGIGKKGGGAVGGAAAGAAGGAATGAAGQTTQSAADKALTAAMTANSAATTANTTSTTAGSVATKVASTSSDALAISTDASTVSQDTLGASTDLLQASNLLGQATDQEQVAGDQEVVTAMGTLVSALYADAGSNAIPLAVGAWNVPQNMHAIIHKGEMVVPAAAAAQLRDGAGLNYNQGRATQSSIGGSDSGGDTHIHIHAVDAKSFQNLLNANGHIVVNALGLQARNGRRPTMGVV